MNEIGTQSLIALLNAQQYEAIADYFRAVWSGQPRPPLPWLLTEAQRQEIERRNAKRRATRRLAAQRREANRVRPAPEPESLIAAEVRRFLKIGPSPAGCSTWTLQLQERPTDRALLGAFVDWLDEQIGSVSPKSAVLRALALHPIATP